MTHFPHHFPAFAILNLSPFLLVLPVQLLYPPLLHPFHFLAHLFHLLFLFLPFLLHLFPLFHTLQLLNQEIVTPFNLGQLLELLFRDLFHNLLNLLFLLTRHFLHQLLTIGPQCVHVLLVLLLLLQVIFALKQSIIQEQWLLILIQILQFIAQKDQILGIIQLLMFDHRYVIEGIFLIQQHHNLPMRPFHSHRLLFHAALLEPPIIVLHHL